MEETTEIYEHYFDKYKDYKSNVDDDFLAELEDMRYEQNAGK